MSKKEGEVKKVGRIPEEAPISEDEEKLLKLFRDKEGARIDKHGISLMTQLRFIRGFNQDPNPIEKSVQMFTQMIQWREDAKVSDIVNTRYPKEDDFKRLWISGLHGTTRSGHVIYIERLGLIDPSKIMKTFSVDEILNFHIQMMERVQRYKEEISEKLGKRQYKQLVILDMKGLGMSHLGSKFTGPMKKAIHIDQFYYPETLHKLFITNAGFILKTLWKMVSPFLDPITKSNIFFGSDNIHHYVDKSQLPRFLGGTCKCKDGNCLIEPFIPGDPETGSASGLGSTSSLNSFESLHADPDKAAAALEGGQDGMPPSPMPEDGSTDKDVPTTAQ